MRRLISTVGLTLAALFWAPALLASPVHKCEVDGKVSYQSIPCANAQPSARPTVEQLNAERRKRDTGVAAAPGTATATPVPRPGPGSVDSPAAKSNPSIGFRCDGRKHCSQMTSCSEAKLFLARCPGTQMDGDGDGVPCEQQWCTGSQ